MSIHIDRLKILDYRGIHNLELQGLNHINILTGDNNSGKTSVLEVLSTIDNPEDVGTWAQVIRGRGPFTSYYDGFYNLFPIESDSMNIAYCYQNGSGEIIETSMTAEIENTQIPENEMNRINGLMRTGSSKRPEKIIDAEALKIYISMDEDKKSEYQIYDFQTRISHFVNKEVRHFRTRYISPSIHSVKTVHLADILSNGKLYEEMLQLLHKFDPDIIGINAIPISNGASGVKYVVMTKGRNRALPLSVYGDGMKKAITIMAGLIETKGGILLLDEFETAIHTSAMDKVFTWLLESAIKLEVQVFLTSHSKEAICKILHLSKNLQDNITHFTLYRDGSESMVRRMDCREAIKANEQLGLELR